MSAWLEKYRGFEVEVHYLSDNTMYKDRGRLTDFGDGWLELQKGIQGMDVFLLPTTAVRIVKIVGPPTHGSTRLLRPATPELPAEEIELIGEER